MKARNLAILATAAVALYLVLLAGRAVALLGTGEPVPMLLGAGVLVLPLLGVWMLWMTWRSGNQIQRLARKLEAEGGLPDVSDLPRRPSGRVDRTAADTWFEERRAELEQEPDDWRRWYRLAYAYDIAGDRSRARATMRKAVELEAAGDGTSTGSSSTDSSSTDSAA
ncbi:hypothetical protein BJF85_09180 [Saccharomonospora sp. CUA-673]|uniref:hypothetical protein n=1 Tax=Saccharomonospora sp. CUA-673 TaxID=1904969 RepID=UPI0009662E70|nr:hypothetical protein [Saccharomonospora sp. CUA-673]OLT38496.1 hypothetical protein BJF85_09180 [Saccharomonospora sp. CUA-673]